MKKIIRLTEDDLTRIVKQVINESSNEEDVKGKKCESCGKGTYKETEPMDDLRGTLHCSKCDKMVDRYKKYTPFKKKSNKLSESDLTRIVKRVINESEKNEDGKIHIPSRYGGVRMELGKSANPREIIHLYNEIVEEGSTLVDFSEYGTKGMFYNEDNDEIPLDVILDELNYAITGGEDEDEY